ncbi:ABC transporter ATP-binding protein [Paludibacterium yongneupense]|uniref:ABC transporter ATP-binding protein n=1 Tax=Paludibacterium yongneupense TaxID=400061 RepID=UPI0003F6FE88|nr:ABC transporter ATP-binding protein [Paludibacterium yongneupense]
MAFLDIAHVGKTFGAASVVNDVNLAIEKGEFVTLLGPSGCGKTTLLRMIAGFESASSGSIHIDGHDVTLQRARQRRVGMVFQSYALFPTMTVADNIAYGLKIAREPKSAIAERVEQMMKLIRLSQHAQHYPWQLSGGQQQRVALARALASSPRLLLLDEPLSALDAKIRVALRDEIRALQRKLGITTLFVTHDQEEALSLSDRVVVMNEGRIEQVGTPFEIYNFPRTRFVASFVGTLNILNSRVLDEASGLVEVDGQTVTVARLRRSGHGERTLALRPEAVVLESPLAGRNSLMATIEEVNFLGSVVRLRARLQETVLSFDIFNDPGQTLPQRGSRVALGFSHDNLLELEAS